MSSQQGPPQDDLNRGVVGLAFAGILIIGISFAFSPGPAAVPGLILGVFLSLLVIAVGRFPVPASIAFIMAFGCAALGFVDELPTTAFLVPIFCGVLAYHHRTLWIILPAAISLILGVMDPESPVSPVDFLALTIWAFIIVSAIGMGRLLGARKLQRDRLRTQWERNEQKQRDRLASNLHDSVVSSLTSVVMRAESLTLVPLKDVDLPGELEEIADDARVSMIQVRELIRVLKADTIQIPPQLHPRTESIQQTITRLREAGFIVTSSFSLNRNNIPEESGNALVRVLPEIGTNIIKHAAPGSEITVDAHIRGKGLVFNVENRITPERLSISRPYLSSGQGLESIAKTIRAAGGCFTAGEESGMWLTRIELPS